MSATERKQAERARKRAAGLVKLEVWAAPQLHPKIKRYVAKLSSKPKVIP